MKTTKRLLLSVAIFAGMALPAYAQQPALQPGADPALTQQADPALAKLVPADAAGKPFTAAIALGSPPDDFRNEKGEPSAKWSCSTPTCAAVSGCPSSSVAAWWIHCHTWLREISAVAASSMRL